MDLTTDRILWSPSIQKYHCASWEKSRPLLLQRTWPGGQAVGFRLIQGPVTSLMMKRKLYAKLITKMILQVSSFSTKPVKFRNSPLIFNIFPEWLSHVLNVSSLISLFKKKNTDSTKIAAHPVWGLLYPSSINHSFFVLSLTSLSKPGGPRGCGQDRDVCRL